MVREGTSRYDPSESDVWLLLMQNCDLNVMLSPLSGGASSLPLGSSILFLKACCLRCLVTHVTQALVSSELAGLALVAS